MVSFGGGYRYGARKAWQQEVLLGFMEDKGALSCPWSQGCSPTVHLQIKLFLREPLEAKPGAGPGPAASQVASIRCPPG